MITNYKNFNILDSHDNNIFCGVNQMWRRDSKERVFSNMNILRTGKLFAFIIAGMMLTGGFLVLASNESESQASGVVGPIDDSSIIMINGYRFDINDGPGLLETMMAEPVPAGTTSTYLVHMTGPVLNEWAEEIERNGAEIVTYVHNFAYHIRATPEQTDSLMALPFIDWVGDYHPAYKVSPDIDSEMISISLYDIIF